MDKLISARVEETPEGVISLDAVVGTQHDGSPLLARHLLRELDIAALWLAGSINDERVLQNVDPMDVSICRRDFYLRRVQCEQSEHERQRYLIRAV